jgi:hypothetical protein
LRAWWPFFVVIFYVLAPLPTIIARRYQDDVGSSNACKELALFLTAGIVISAYGLPIVLARSPMDPSPIVSKSLFFSLNYSIFSLIFKSILKKTLLLIIIPLLPVIIMSFELMYFLLNLTTLSIIEVWCAKKYLSINTWKNN